MTLGGDGCYFAQYGCPKHGIHRVGFIRDVWAEAHQNAANDEQACLSRALSQWIYCGSSLSSPIVSIYRPTGNILHITSLYRPMDNILYIVRLYRPTGNILHIPVASIYRPTGNILYISCLYRWTDRYPYL